MWIYQFKYYGWEIRKIEGAGRLCGLYRHSQTGQHALVCGQTACDLWLEFLKKTAAVGAPVVLVL